MSFVRALRTGVAASLFAVMVPLAAAPVSAAPAPQALDTWGVYNSVTSGTLSDRVDSEVMAIEQIGQRIYVGGKFTEVRAYISSPPISQSFLAAFDANTGAYVAGFDVDLSGPVYALEASPDGSRLFVGGEFNDVDGVPNTRALVALDPTTGDVDTSWKAQIKLNGRAAVTELAVDTTHVYAGGSFDGVGGGEGVPRLNVRNLAKLSLSNGAPDRNFDAFANGGQVWGLAVSPDRSRVYVSGYFNNVNNVPGSEGFAVLDQNGDTIATPLNGLHNNLARKVYLDVEAVNGLVFVAGMEHITWVLNASNLSVRTRHSSGGTSNALFQQGGDFQDLEVVGDRVYAACHCRGSHFADGDIFRWLMGGGGTWNRQDPIKFVAAYSATTGAYIPSFRLDVSGSSGVWAIHGASDGCLWVGGDLTRATRPNGTNQARGGFTRHCDPNMVSDTVRPSVPTRVQASATPGGGIVDVTWNAASDNVGVVGYQIYRAATNGGAATRIGSSTRTNFTDTAPRAGANWYYVRAVDAAGNLSWRSGYRLAATSNADTERPSPPTGLVLDTAWTRGATVTWNASTDNVAVAGYRIYDADSGVLRATSGGANSKFVGGLTPGTTYRLFAKAFDAAGNESWRSNIVTFTTQ